jgi:hypothetical protein
MRRVAPLFTDRLGGPDAAVVELEQRLRKPAHAAALVRDER